MFQVVIQEAIEKDLKGIPKQDILKIYKRIKSLETFSSIDSFKLVNSDIYIESGKVILEYSLKLTC